MASSDESSEEKERGLICPKCSCRDFRVSDTEPLRDGRIRRRRWCRHCGRKIITFENRVSAERPADSH
jgi:transcriptional regulator NrdR family protein